MILIAVVIITIPLASELLFRGLAHGILAKGTTAQSCNSPWYFPTPRLHLHFCMPLLSFASYSFQKSLKEYSRLNQWPKLLLLHLRLDSPMALSGNEVTAFSRPLFFAQSPLRQWHFFSSKVYIRDILT